ncbi:MAG: hypothetical protein M1335_02435 [Chloroflexi bacterium]|nr:hypothetical protein [Chloroflexota bacterium]
MLENLFKSKLTIRVLDAFYARHQEEFYVRELARYLNEPVSSVAKQLETLTVIGLLKSWERGGVKYHSLNGDCPIAGEVDALFAKTTGICHEIKRRLQNENGIDLAYLVGDARAGWPFEKPLELVVVGRGIRDVAECVSHAADRVGRPIHLSTYTPDEYRLLPDEEVAGFHTVLIG